jgi:hypothetical protein
LADWYREWDSRLASVDLIALSSRELEEFSTAYAVLLDINGFGPTAASKILFATRPHTAMPWDALIQKRLGFRNGTPCEYWSFLERSITEIRMIVEDAMGHGIDDPCKAACEHGEKVPTLPWLLDKYHWITITRHHKIPTCEELRQWTQWSRRSDQSIMQLSGEQG